MPTYVYFDPETDEEMEIVHGMTEEPEIVNPNTGNKMKRRIFSGMVIFKGEGWTAAAKKDDKYQVDKAKDEIRGGVREDPYKKYRDEPL